MSGELEFNVSLEIEQLRADVRKVQQEFTKLGNKAQAEGSRIDNVFKNLGGAIAGYFGTQQLLAFGKAIIDTTAKFEKFGIVLENTLGSKELADSALAMVAEFAATTPFSLEELSDSFIRLTNQGLQPTREELVKMGDLASSTGKGFTQLTEAILDAQTGEFERLKEFGIKASKEGDKITFTFKGQKTQIDNTSQSIKNYIVGLGDLEGITGANAKIAESLSGQISNLGDAYDQLLYTIGKTGQGGISGSVSGLSSMIKDLTEYIKTNDDSTKSVTEKFSEFNDVAGKTNIVVGPIVNYFKRISESALNIIPGLDRAIGKLKEFFGISEKKIQGPGAIGDAGTNEHKDKLRKEIVQYYNERKEFYKKKYDTENKLSEEELKKRVEAAQKYEETLIQQQQELENINREMGFNLIQAEIDGMDEGMFKLLKQNELNHAIKLAQIDDQAKERLAKIQELEKLEFLKSGGKEEKFKPKTIELNQTDKDYFQALKNAEITSYNKTNNKLIEENTKAQEEQLKKLILEFENFQQKKLRVAEEYDKKIADLRDQNTSGQYNDIILQAEQNKMDALLEIDKEIASREASFIVWSERLTSMGLTSLLSALETANSALNDNNLSETEKSVLRVEIATLKERIRIEEERNKQGSQANKQKKDWKETLDIMNSVNQTLSQMISNFDGLDQVTKDAVNAASNVAGGIISMISAIKALAVAGEAAIKGVERASAILMIATAAVTVISSIVGLFKKNREEEQARQEAIQEATRKKMALQAAYNQMLREQALLMKDAESIFGVNSIAKATRSIEMVNQLNQEYADIMNSVAYTLTLPGATNGLDVSVRNMLFSRFPGLIDAAGNFNLEMAKAVLNTQELDEGTKQILTDLINIEESAQDAREALKGYLEETFGALGEDLMNSINEALRSGVDAWESFGDAGAKVLEKLANQIAYSIFFADDFKKLEQELTDLYSSGKSEEEILSNVSSLINSFYVGLETDAINAQSFLEQFRKQNPGFELWSSDNTSSREASKKGFASMSQESADELNGRFTALQGFTYEINNSVKLLVTNSGRILDLLGGIQANTDYCRRLETIEGDMHSVKVNLENINTKGIYIRT